MPSLGTTRYIVLVVLLFFYSHLIQVMYTPGNSPPSQRPQKKSTRFSRAVSSKSQHSQSIMLPTNIPNTSQILADNGSLPNVQIHYTIPADEKQIVASLRTLQRDLN